MTDNAALGSRSSSSWKLPTYLVVTVVAVWALIGFAPALVIHEWQERGQLGDMFGVANALFSALAFAGVIYTVFLQREELSLQRRELELTRDELARTATAQEASERMLGAQAIALEAAARIGALQSMLEYLRVREQLVQSAAKVQEIRRRQDEIAAALERELERLGALPTSPVQSV